MSERTMPAMLHELENNEAVLLMYLAGELPDADRAEVEQLLQSDAGMRASLEALHGLHGEVTGAIAGADEVAFPAAGEASRRNATVRRVSRAMTAFQVERPNGRAVARRERASWVSRVPRWVYPVAAAAVLLIALVGYWGFTNGNDASDRLATAPQVPDGDGLVTPPATQDGVAGAAGNEGGIVSPLNRPAGPDPYEATAEVMPATSQFPRAVDESDRNYIAFSAGSYDVSTLFNPEPAEANP